MVRLSACREMIAVRSTTRLGHGRQNNALSQPAGDDILSICSCTDNHSSPKQGIDLCHGQKNSPTQDRANRRPHLHAGGQPHAEEHAGPDRKRVWRGGHHAVGHRHGHAHQRHLHRQPVARHRPGRTGRPLRPRGRGVRPRVERQDHARPARGGQCPAQRRHRRLHRRRARPGPLLGQETRRRTGDIVGEPAKLRRGSHAHHRDAHQVATRST